MKNKIDDLRNHLFAALEGLADPDKPMDIARAKAISETAQVLINSAKVEVDFLKVTGAPQATGFIPQPSLQESLPQKPIKPIARN